MDLREFQEKRSSRDALKKERELLLERQGELCERIKQEKTNLDYERSDIEALEGKTLKSFFYSAIGKKEEKLMKEADELDEAERKYEASQKELKQVNEEIRRVELALQRLQRAEREYQRLAKSLPARLEAVKPLLSGADALDAEVIYRELQEQQDRQTLYGEIIEEGEKLISCISSVDEALSDMLHEANYGTFVGELEARKEAEEREKLVQIQEKRLQACLAKGVRFSNSYSIDIKNVEDRIKRAILASSGNRTPIADDRLSETPDIALNVQGILDETRKKIERSREHQVNLEARLTDLLKKYEA